MSDWYLDARQTTFSGEGARLVGAAVWTYLRDADAVGGIGYTAGFHPEGLGLGTDARGSDG